MGDFVFARKLRVSERRCKAFALAVLGTRKRLHEKGITGRIEVSGSVNPRTTKSVTAGNTVHAGV